MSLTLGAIGAASGFLLHGISLLLTGVEFPHPITGAHIRSHTKSSVNSETLKVMVHHKKVSCLAAITTVMELVSDKNMQAITESAEYIHKLASNRGRY